jgi:hypothetical protein
MFFKKYGKIRIAVSILFAFSMMSSSFVLPTKNVFAEEVIPVCDPNIELVKNGGFEDVVVTEEKMWTIFPWDTSNLSWHSTTLAYGLEVQAGYGEGETGEKWGAYEGNQYAEIDGDPTTPVLTKFSTNSGYKYKFN